MNRLESTIEDVHDGRVIHCLPDEWNRTAKVLVEEIDRLRRELAECRKARETAERNAWRNQRILHRLVESWPATWTIADHDFGEILRHARLVLDRDDATVSSRPDRDELGRIVREAYRSAYADIVGKPPLLPPWDREDGRDGTREIERRVADAVVAAVVAAPAAIVYHAESSAHHAFESYRDADEFMDAGGFRQMYLVREWTWHPAGAPGGPRP